MQNAVFCWPARLLPIDVLQLPLPGTQVDLLDDAGMISAENIGSFSATRHLAAEDDLVFSTFVGSDGGDFGEAIAIDDVGAVYIGGTTTSTYFTPTVGLMPTLHGVDVFSLKLSPDGSALDYVIWINPNPDQQDDEDHGLGVGVTLRAMPMWPAGHSALIYAQQPDHRPDMTRHTTAITMRLFFVSMRWVPR